VKPVPTKTTAVFGAPTSTFDGEICFKTGAGYARAAVAEPDFVVSAWLTAVMVTDGGFGAESGAMYSPLLEIVPTELFPPVTPFTCHVTTVLAVPVTVAVNCCVPFTRTFADAGDTATVIVGGGGGGGGAPPLLAPPQPS
jgi:hypothetical protein